MQLLKTPAFSGARPLDFGADLNLSVVDEWALMDGHQFRLASPMEQLSSVSFHPLSLRR
jgi:hypothetical protein